ncbi:hypothetical protein A4A49_37852 [Nicotiana attenuata]|uniref:Uncharacterized protein n=1 Tax=Nicotiana attenuata TaxID=49451 RepID=A0A1J6KEV6_NICAT|nr:hypothetical protein A4A49_37852 [Nicotiana attenuata]
MEERQQFAVEEGLHQAVVLKLSPRAPDLQVLTTLLPKIIGDVIVTNVVQQREDRVAALMIDKGPPTVLKGLVQWDATKKTVDKARDIAATTALERLNSALQFNPNSNQNVGKTEAAAVRNALGGQVADGDVTSGKNMTDAGYKAGKSGEIAAKFTTVVQQTLSNSQVLRAANDPATPALA